MIKDSKHHEAGNMYDIVQSLYVTSYFWSWWFSSTSIQCVGERVYYVINDKEQHEIVFGHDEQANVLP
jgi:hypothetical protein